VSGIRQENWIGRNVELRVDLKRTDGRVFTKGSVFHVVGTAQSRRSSHRLLVLSAIVDGEIVRISCVQCSQVKRLQGQPKMADGMGDVT
jgi:hypothetical protein